MLFFVNFTIYFKDQQSSKNNLLQNKNKRKPLFTPRINLKYREIKKKNPSDLFNETLIKINTFCRSSFKFLRIHLSFIFFAKK